MFRLLNEPEFSGYVTPGREYIIVDDNYTMGGTIASLRSYIEANKGKVICATVLADQNQSTNVLEKIRAHEIRWNISDETIDTVQEKFGWCFERNFERALGFGLNSLTEREGKFVGRFENQHAFFEAVNNERVGTETAKRRENDFSAIAPSAPAFL